MTSLNNFRRLGGYCNPFGWKERLRLDACHVPHGDDDKFFFDWKWLVESGLSVKDFIAPLAFVFKKQSHVSDGQSVWLHVFSIYYGIRSQRPNAGRLSGYGSPVRL